MLFLRKINLLLVCLVPVSLALYIWLISARFEVRWRSRIKMYAPRFFERTHTQPQRRLPRLVKYSINIEPTIFLSYSQAGKTKPYSGSTLRRQPLSVWNSNWLRTIHLPTSFETKYEKYRFAPLLDFMEYPRYQIWYISQTHGLWTMLRQERNSQPYYGVINMPNQTNQTNLDAHYKFYENSRTSLVCRLVWAEDDGMGSAHKA